MALPIDKLRAYCEGFLGYGNPEAPVWYVGMEEYGGKTEDEVLARIRAWNDRGQHLIEDMRGFCRDSQYPPLVRYASTSAPRSPTWCALIEDRWAIDGRADIANDEVLKHQQTQWLAPKGDTCLVNLMPLPSPDTKTWNYADWGGGWSEWPDLYERCTYMDALAPLRARLLHNALRQYIPKCTILLNIRH